MCDLGRGQSTAGVRQKVMEGIMQPGSPEKGPSKSRSEGEGRPSCTTRGQGWESCSNPSPVTSFRTQLLGFPASSFGEMCWFQAWRLGISSTLARSKALRAEGLPLGAL